MKKALSLLCLLLAAALLLTVTAAGASAATVPLDDGVYAVIDLIDGDEITVDDAPSAALMDDAQAYELYVEYDPVLTVEHLRSGVGSSAEAPQFYSVNFTFAGTLTEVFLTGLRAENVEEIQQRLIDSYVRGESFELTDLGFIDAEKTYNADSDDDLCWAASAADMLVYTGWAAQAGFDTADDVFEAFIDAFDNAGGHQFYAFSWFFNGAVMHDNSGDYGARAVDYPNSGAYLADYAFDRYTVSGNFTVNDMDKVAAHLRAGSAVGIGTYVYYDGSDDYAGHAVTMWGYVVDNSMPADDPGRYLSIFLTDSDSDEMPDADRRDAPDVMSVYALEAYEGHYWFDFDERTTGVIYDYVALAPYSPDSPRETDPDASKDKINAPDLSIGSIFASDNGQVREQKTLFESGSTVSFTYQVNNFSDTAYCGYLYPCVTLTKDDGTVLIDNRSRVYDMTRGISTRGIVTIPFLSASDLEAGDYTLTFSVNPDHNAGNAVAEAYYYNNTQSFTFRVRDSYLSGDFDGNGEINILDATKIQRSLAGFSVIADAKAQERGDVNGSGLNILDATLIQRYLASLTVAYPVGEKLLYQ